MLNSDQEAILVARLNRTEGRRNKPYIDTVGKITIGVGHNLTAKGLPGPMIDELLSGDIADATQEAESLPVYTYLDPIRQTVLVDMVFNMGVNDVKEFVNMLSAIKRRDYATAASCMLQSKWADQVGSRAIELARIMSTGQL